ncbi:MAG: 2-C-methyl-D-erythritol 4-phosphate cytidylyltransferase [Atopobiaceae bacterium]|nr:2-C-methyl-D-erythritol 4-phosphate cytidylyltransferase [Atopobiaceae bacterium]
MSTRVAPTALASPAPAFLGERGPLPDTSAIIVAGGLGERFGDPQGKQFVTLAGKPLACWAVLAFHNAPSVAEIVVVCSPDKRGKMYDEVIAPLKLEKPVRFADAGVLRQGSCLSGLRVSDPTLTYAAIHDAARPLIKEETIEGALALLRSDESLDGVVVAQPAVDTLKLCDGDEILATPDRSRYWYAQTPQIFRRTTALSAHEQAAEEGIVATDDASLVERVGGKVRCYSSGWGNFKVTYHDDLFLAEAVLDARFAQEGSASAREGSACV